jgi:hypothetical protein
MTLKDTYSPRLKKGDVVEVDAIAVRHDCTSGLLLRVVGVWKRPRWFDFGWFVTFSNRASMPNGALKG